MSTLSLSREMQSREAQSQSRKEQPDNAPVAPSTVKHRAPMFVLRASGHTLEAEGCLARLPSGDAASLGRRVSAFFAAAPEGPQMLVGALPFDPRAGDALYQPARLTLPGALKASSAAELPALAGDALADPPAADYADMVARCVSRLSGEPENAGLEKAVLARSLRLQATDTIEPLALAARLERDPSVTTYVTPLPVSGDAPPAWLVGATPELLISRRGRTVISHPLAGSARRSADAGEDARTATALEASSKDLAEHRYVVDAIVEALAPLCSELGAPDTPALHATESMWHLGTRIVGTLKDPAISAATLAGLLHPTPAVCGTPRQPALDAIAALEPVARGFYAGAVGWVDARGDGDWYVAIRCARVQANTLHLFAGAGIVEGSVPALEVEETAAKFTALLDALGVDAAVSD